MKTADNYIKAMHEAAQSGDWDKAIEHAKKVPANWGAFDQLPSTTEEGIPPHAFDKVLAAAPKHDRANFHFELANRLHPDLTHEQLDAFGQQATDDHSVQQRIQEHPNWNPSSSEKSLSEKAASDFFRSYERRVEPHHFATVKSMYSGQPEEITDHRGKTGHSHKGHLSDGFIYEHDSSIATTGPKFYGKTFVTNLEHVIPHLQNHAKKVQAAVLNDEHIEKKVINGKTHIKLYRGVGGEYAKKIADAAKYEPSTHTVENKKLKIKSAPFSSWTTDKEVADRFATSREHQLSNYQSQNKPGHSAVIESWVPIDQVLHSGYHTIHTAQEHAHPSEYEIVVGHPTGSHTINSKDLHFINTLGHITDKTTPVTTRPKLKKTEQLTKGPIPLAPGESERLGQSQPYAPLSGGHNVVATKKMVNGLYHHIYQDKRNPEIVTHVISKSHIPFHDSKPNPLDNPVMALIEGEKDGDNLYVHTAHANPHHAGKGFGKLAYAAALHHHGRLYSDELLSEQAEKAWKQMPGVKKYGAARTLDRHSAYLSTKAQKDLGDKLYGLQMSELQKATPKPIHVWRVQNELGEGPYQEFDWQDEGRAHDSTSGHPEIHLDPGFSPQDKSAYDDTKHKSGFTDEKQMMNWFTPTELGRLADLGYHPTKIRAKRVWNSGKQVFFEPHLPTKRKP